MENLNRMNEILIIIITKSNELKNINKANEPQIYKKLNDEINELKIELKDLSQIALADSSINLEKADKKLEDIRNQIDFENMESDELRLFGKMHNYFAEIEKELETIDFSKLSEDELPSSSAILQQDEIDGELNNILPL